MEISELLVRTGAYRDLEEPVIVTSGEFLTPFFVNAERLCGDAGIDAFLSAHGESDSDIIEHACGLASRVQGFAAVVAEAARHVRTFAASAQRVAVSGGQRRDWLFSGPVSRRLGLPHVSLFKQAPGQQESDDRLIVRRADGSAVEGASLEGMRVVHVVDMITAASSCYARDVRSRREVGWIPMLRARGADVTDLVAVLTRRQGGEEALARAGVQVQSLAAVDEAFLRSHARDPVEAISYLSDEAAWTRRYLAERGLAVLLPYLTRDAKKLPRLLKFVRTYRSFLFSEGMWAELEDSCRTRLGQGLDELLGGEG